MIIQVDRLANQHIQWCETDQLTDSIAHDLLILIWYIHEKIINMSSNLVLMIYALCHNSILR